MISPRRRPLKALILSLDVGQSPAPSALAVIERTGNPPAIYGVTYLRRWELGSRYQQVVADVKEIWNNPAVAQHRRELVVDKTGVGRPIVELFEDAGLEPWGITVTGGFEVTQVNKAAEFHVPRRVLISTVQVVLQGQRVRIADTLSEAAQLQQELLGLKLKVTPEGEQFEAGAPGGRDDLVMAVADGLWFGEYVLGEIDADGDRRAGEESGKPDLPLRI